jgi:5-methylcytosine-specific restriction protein A
MNARNRTGSGRDLNQRWSIGAAHALYHKNGTWFNVLERFPGALCDPQGYVLFATKQQFLDCPYLQVGARVNVHGTLSEIPGYVRIH